MLIDSVYTERAYLVALLAAQYPSRIGYADPAEPDWAVVFIDTPEGQLFWHVSSESMHLFSHVRPITPEDPEWDGHSTEEKYQRIRRLTEVESRL